MSTEKIGVNEIKTKNRQIIYNYIRKQGSVSKQEIVVEMQLSLPTVTTNLDFLKKQGLIDTSGKIKNTGGRNATAFTYVKNARMAIGVDITANHITAVAVNLSGDIVSMERRRSNFDLEDDAYLREIGEVVECVKKDADIMDENLLGVGISVQSLVSDDGCEITYGMALNFAKKKREEIAAYVPYRNRLIHDSYAAGYRETWTNREFQNAFYISLSNSVGGSVIIDDAIYEGNTHKGGEVGHMTVVPEGGELCYCGRRGCFDTVCRAGRLTGYTDGSVEEFFRLLEEGDETAKGCVMYLADCFALALRNILLVFDPELVAFVGDYAHAGSYFNQRMKDKLKEFKYCADDALSDILYEKKSMVELDNSGAAIAVADYYFNDMKIYEGG